MPFSTRLATGRFQVKPDDKQLIHLAAGNLQPLRPLGDGPTRVPPVKPRPVDTTPTIPVTPPLKPVHPLPLPLDPRLADRVKRWWVPTDGIVIVQNVPREKLNVPVSPSAEPSDQVLFEAPQEAQQKFYLPRYQLGEEQVNGQPRYRIQMAPTSDQRYRISLHLQKFRPTETGSTAASEMNHTLQVVLRYHVQGAAQKERVFEEVTLEEGGIQASFYATNLAMRDEVFHALTEADLNAALVIKRTLTVAVPVSKDSQGKDLYRVKSQVLEYQSEPVPFAFDPLLHSYIFQNITNVSSGSAGVRPHLVQWKGRQYRYWQDTVQPEVFYYLPDQYKVMRQASFPYLPGMLVHIDPGEDDQAEPTFTLEYTAVPVVDRSRLEAASEALKPKIGGSGDAEAQFDPLAARSDQIQYRLQLPEGSAIQRKAFDGVVTDLWNGFSHVISDLSRESFNNLFQAMLSSSTVLFTGEILVPVEDSGPEAIPFSARLNDLAGDVLEVSEVPDSGRVQILLKNAIESTVRIDRLPATLIAADQEQAAHLENLSAAGQAITLPHPLKTGEELSCQVVPDSALPANTAASPDLDAVIQLDQVEVLPEKETVWDAIVSPSAMTEYNREIQVKALEEMFAPCTNIAAAVLDFMNGQSVQLDKNHLTATATVQIPIKDYVLRNVQFGEYHYQLTLIRASGQEVSQQSAQTGILFPISEMGCQGGGNG